MIFKRQWFIDFYNMFVKCDDIHTFVIRKVPVFTFPLCNIMIITIDFSIHYIRYMYQYYVTFG